MRHRYHYLIGTVLCLFLLVAGVQPRAANGQVGAVDFDIDAVTLMAQGQGVGSRVDLYTRMALTELAFQPSPDGFVARYRIGAEIVELDARGRRGNLVESPVWDRTVRVPNFGDTKDSQRFDYTTQSLYLRPGRYAVELSLEGEEGGTSFLKETEIEVKSFDDPVSVSDILLLEDYNRETGDVLPSVSNRLGSDRISFSMMYEVYVRQARSVQITRQLFRLADGVAAGDTDPESSEMTFTDSEAKFLESRRSQHIVTIPMDDVRLGRYLVRMSVQDDQGNVLDMSEKEFRVDWMGLAEHISDIDEAIAQLQYIAKRREIRYIREPESKSERLTRFLDFWRKRDPSPGTRRNERMEEYYYRVSHANRRYGSLIDGWKTDRGQVVVLFGEPDFVEGHPYNFNVEPYEVWYYYSIGRRFIFVDRTGLGDYQLLVPIWDERTRIR
jgi:GWxTD domain-containing protein